MQTAGSQGATVGYTANLNTIKCEHMHACGTPRFTTIRHKEQAEAFETRFPTTMCGNQNSRYHITWPQQS